MNKSHHPRKRFGQHFLVDESVIAQIVSFINTTKEDELVEIGPGMGALTLPLAIKCPKMQVLEVDRDLIARLRQQFSRHSELMVHEGDALKTDFGLFTRGKKIRVVGNLPYNISTPLLFHLFDQSHLIEDMHFMMQREIVDRLIAEPRSKNYGRLSVMTQYHCRITPLISVSSRAFRPVPKVESAFIRLETYSKKPWIAICETLLSKVVNTCFQHRRKTLRNCLNFFKPKIDELHDYVDLSQRPEELTVADFVKLSNIIHQFEFRRNEIFN